MVSEKALNEFKKIWKEEFGEDIPDKIALERAIQILTLFEVIYRPLKKEWVLKDNAGNTDLESMS